MLRPYLSILSLRFREVAQYRAAAWAGVFTQIVFGFIIFMSLEAFAASNPAASPMSRRALLAYVAGQAFLALIPWNVDRDVVAMVKTGAVAYELARPIDAYALWYCRALGWRLAATALRCVPLLLIVTAAFPLVGLGDYALPAPPSAAAAAAFLLAMPVAVLLGVALTMLTQVMILWTLQVDGVQRIVPVLVTFCSGMIIPLPMFPDWAKPVLYLLPFRGVVDVPYRAYSGDLPPDEALGAIGLALAWTVALVLLGRAVLARGLGRVVIHGG